MLIGVEKESLFFKKDFKPRNFAQNELGLNMWLDFSSNQVEVISDPKSSVSEVVNQMYSVFDQNILASSKMWPLSQSAINDYEVKFDGLDNELEVEYRRHLSKKYDLNLMNLSGIHFNYSVTDHPGENNREFYLDLMQKIYAYGPLLMQFVSYTPVYQKGILDEGLDDVLYNRGYENSLSLRNSYKYGYYNENKLDLDLSGYEAYKNSLISEINNNTIASEKELYSKVRLKEAGDFAYIELRFIDISPFSRLGISIESLDFIVLFLRHLEDITLESFCYKQAIQNFEDVAIMGRDRGIQLPIDNTENTLENHTIKLLDSMYLNEKFNAIDKQIILDMKNNYVNNTLEIDKFIKILNDEKLTILEYGKKYAHTKEEFSSFCDNSSLELSTKIVIEEAKNRDLNIEILDEYENVIRLSNEVKSEIIVQATKTNADAYADVLMLENKVMTKKLLSEAGINTPRGFLYNKNEIINYDFFKENACVVKPINTNFGLGITILKKNPSLEDIDSAIALATSFEDRIIVEQFFDGVEYRFLVIDKKLVSIVRRDPANVIGDGVHTIKQLVEIKNDTPLRSTGYVTPLELIELGSFEQNYLKQFNLSIDSVPNLGEVIYLRRNSNISTGGDSIEMLDQMPKRFKLIAENATKVMNASICGIDMLICPKYSDYVIIEANFNPAIQMHTYPYSGIGKNPAPYVLDLLFDTDNKGR